jgi:hypothetical protein
MTHIQSTDNECIPGVSQGFGFLLVGHITSLNRLDQEGCPPPDMIAIDLDFNCLKYLSHYEGDDLLNVLFGVFERSINDEPDAYQLIKARIRSPSFCLAGAGGKIGSLSSQCAPGYWLNIMLDRDHAYAEECCRSFAALTQGLLVRLCRESQRR